MTTIRKCPSCGKDPELVQLTNEPWEWELIDHCGKHSAFGFTKIEAIRHYRQACHFTDAELNRNLPNRPLWVRFYDWLGM